MNTTKAAYIDNNFGPPSELVHVAQFIQSTSSALSLPQYPPDIAQQCSVSDIRDSLTSVGDDARLMAHMIKTHELLIASLHMAAEKRTRKRPVVREAPIDTPEILSLQSDLDNVSLESWKLQSNAAIFIRAVKSSDQNILTHSKSTRIDDGHLSAETPQAIISVAVHAILSSQTLGDLFEAIPCTSSEMTEEIVDDGNVTGYQEAPPRRPGAVICIEGLAYGDGENELDYADKLVEHLKAIPKDKELLSITKASTSMYDTTLASLSLRIGEPYWLLHQGNCEHFVVVDQIRLQHPADPLSGYPLTLQITPPLLDVCRGCQRVPAVWSIVNDERLGESPCPMCGPCWAVMGDPKNIQVVAVPLPKYELGW